MSKKSEKRQFERSARFTSDRLQKEFAQEREELNQRYEELKVATVKILETFGVNPAEAKQGINASEGPVPYIERVIERENLRGKTVLGKVQIVKRIFR